MESIEPFLQILQNQLNQLNEKRYKEVKGKVYYVNTNLIFYLPNSSLFKVILYAYIQPVGNISKIY